MNSAPSRLETQVGSARDIDDLLGADHRAAYQVIVTARYLVAL